MKDNYLKNLKIISKGRNNLKIKFCYKNKFYVVKYYSKYKNSFLRFRKEFFFLSLIKNKINNVPQIILSDKKNKFIVYPFIKGYEVKNIKKRTLLECLSFLNSIQIYKKHYFKLNSKIKYATDKSLSLYDFVLLAKKKIKSIKNKNICRHNIFIKNFIDNKIEPSFQNLYNYLLNKYKNDLYKKFKEQSLILSPSDFNFQNTIKYNNKIYFFDFEYLGLDSPLKLICDFLCQPDHPISNKIRIKCCKYFIKKDFLNLRQDLIDDFLLLNRIKWCLIILNYSLKNKNSNKNFYLYFEKSLRYYDKYIKNKCIKIL